MRDAQFIFTKANSNAYSKRVSRPRFLHDCTQRGDYSLRELVDEAMNAADYDIQEWNKFLTKSDALKFAFHKILQTQIGRHLALDARFEEWSYSLILETEKFEILRSERVVHIPCAVNQLSQLAAHENLKQEFILKVFESLRSLWHIHVGAAPLSAFTFESAHELNRIIKADLDIVKIIFAYQSLQGYCAKIWRTILASKLSQLALMYQEQIEFEDSVSFFEDEDAAEQEQDRQAEICADLFLNWFIDDELVTLCDMEFLKECDEKIADTRNLALFGREVLRCEDILPFTVLPESLQNYILPILDEFLNSEEYRGFRSDYLKAHAEMVEQEILELLPPSNILVFRDENLGKIFGAGTVLDTIS